jgi:hypothetical protein
MSKKIGLYCSHNKELGDSYIKLSKNYINYSNIDKLIFLSNIMQELEIEFNYVSNILNTSSQHQGFADQKLHHDEQFALNV